MASWGVAATGRRFSYVSPQWQGQNIDIVGISILGALASGVFFACLVLSWMKKQIIGG
jgi:hypothetical protein